ncbi:MAG: DNA methyltransferase [Hyphomonadaceae bacterium]|nr:DNA methyltransferase [Hyphomonadaceae bacterium]
MFGDATLYLGDARAIVPLLGAFDACVTDPPYGQALNCNVITTNKRGGLAKRASPTARYPATIHGDDAPFDPAWLLDLAPAQLIWGAHKFARRLPEDGRWLVWDKLKSGLAQADGEIAWTNRAPPGGGGVRVFRFLWNGLCVDGRARHEVGAYIRRVHPTQKPEALMGWCLRELALKPRARIIDPYMGAGSTGVAAVRAGFRFVGVEIEPKYFAEACTRLESMSAQGDLLAPRVASEPRWGGLGPKAIFSTERARPQNAGGVGPVSRRAPSPPARTPGPRPARSPGRGPTGLPASAGSLRAAALRPCPGIDLDAHFPAPRAAPVAAQPLRNVAEPGGRPEPRHGLRHGDRSPAAAACLAPRGERHRALTFVQSHAWLRAVPRDHAPRLLQARTRPERAVSTELSTNCPRLSAVQRACAYSPWAPW